MMYVESDRGSMARVPPNWRWETMTGGATSPRPATASITASFRGHCQMVPRSQVCHPSRLP